ncbi:hypothetical protein [Microbacterium sp. NPDC058345]|uniref:hypothetical protein n=1 Tax=Microbacterium sp. NPDC058345 TaxID=3346455 RepID=UPI00365401CF
MDRERHTELLEAVQRELEQPLPNLNLPIAALRKQIAEHVSDRVYCYAFPEDPALSDADWAQLVLPGLLKMGASGGSDRMRAQRKMVEVMHDPDRELRGFLSTTRDSDEYIALRGLVELYIERTQSALRKEGLTTVDLWRRGQRSELH